MCVKMKELGPVGGVSQAHPLDPPIHSYSSAFYSQNKGVARWNSWFLLEKLLHTVPDPGFPVGGMPTRWEEGASTSDVGVF